MYAEFFGGVAEIQKRLVEVVKKARIKRNYSCEKLDDYCGIAAGTTEAVENDPSKITSHIFSDYSFALDLCIDEAIDKKLSAEEIQTVIEDMKATGNGVVGHDVPYETQAPVYAILSALHEIDDVVGE